MQGTPSEQQQKEQPFLQHLVELRSRLLHSIICVITVFVILTFFSNDLYSIVARPLINQLSPGNSMIATEVAATFVAPFKFAFYVSVFICMPYIIYQAWAFIAPGLYANERRIALPLLIISIVLFYAGLAFAYYVIFPLMFAFFVSIAPDGVTVMTDISRYLDFIMKIFFAFGFAFEVPIVTILLTCTGVTSVESLKRNRPYIIVGAFVLGMLLTPPDVLSQLLLALPIWMLFELGLLLSKYFDHASSVTNEHGETE